MNNMTLAGVCLSLVCLCGCQKELVEYKQGDVKVYIEQGEEWLHDFPLFMGIKKRNPHGATPALLCGAMFHKLILSVWSMQPS